MLGTSDGHCQESNTGLQSTWQKVAKTNVIGWLSRKGSRGVDVEVHQISLKAEFHEKQGMKDRKSYLRHQQENFRFYGTHCPCLSLVFNPQLPR